MKYGKAHSHFVFGAAILVASGFAIQAGADHSNDDLLLEFFDEGVRYSDRIEFPNRVGVLGNVATGRGQFGIAADGVSSDSSTAIFQGNSQIAGPVVSNGRICFTCHRPDQRLGLNKLPLHDHIAANDVLFTGLVADTGNEPLGLVNFDELGLLFHRPGRFNPLLPATSPFRQVFFWRKSTPLNNVVFTFGNLNDGRMRELTETTRGALFVHTQNGDLRFDDLIPLSAVRNIAAFMESTIDPPELADLLDPAAPLHDTLVNNPFYTVNATTQAEKRGQKLFQKHCFTCHNMPNVFSNRDHVDGLPLSFPPHDGHVMDIGVAQQNFHDLEFRRFDAATGQRVPVVLPLVKQDGTRVQYTVTDDVGTAASTGRYEDLHRFKVPQLRRVKDLAPYFHDNSMATLADVIDYFDSPAYNNSKDGRKHPIHLNDNEKADLVAFLNVL